jgi:eukaryotic-like serine/threonine-protein kinase
MSTPSTPAPRMLGRYELVHALGVGGMGEVYLAKLSGAGGFEKFCVVKSILPHLVADRDFVDRFHHEAKILVQLSHSNIAQVYDMGDADGTLFMALEYVPGVDLSLVQERARSLGIRIPIPIGLYLGQKVAEALGYAHRKVGPDGSPLGLVHRDVSPQNVMVSYEGEVKVIDFGLAKSAARSKKTMPSTMLGKLGYMSPEQARAEKLDWRSDLYSSGLVTWELLAGRSFFQAETVGEMVVAMINARPIPLPSVRPEVSPEIDQVVQRALALDPAKRWQRGDDFARALNEQLVRSGAQVGAEEVGAFVRDLCKQECDAQRKLISQLSTLGAKKRPSDASVFVRESKLEAAAAPLGATAPTSRSTLTEPTFVRTSDVPHPRRRSSTLPIVLGAIFGLLVVTGLAVFFFRDRLGWGPAPASPPTGSAPDVAIQTAPAALAAPSVPPPSAVTAPLTATPPTTIAAAAAQSAPASAAAVRPPTTPTPPEPPEEHAQATTGKPHKTARQKPAPREKVHPTLSAGGGPASSKTMVAQKLSETGPEPGVAEASGTAAAAPAPHPAAEPAPPAPNTPLVGRVAFRAFGRVEIFNDGAVPWTSCNLRLNNGTHATMASLKAHASDTFRGTLFQGDNDGSPVNSVTVTCREGVGQFKGK